MPSTKFRATLFALVILLIGLAAGCGGHSSQPASALSTSETIRYVSLERGVYHRVDWELYGYMVNQDGPSLCLEVVPPGRPRDVAQWTSACGFNRRHRDSYYYAQSLGPKDSQVSFGPLPLDAARVKVATHFEVPARELTTTPGFPRAKYWLLMVPSDWPRTGSPAGKSIKAYPVNKHGNRIPFKAFH